MTALSVLQMARQLGISKSQVQRAYVDGMPLSSLEAARAWRAKAYVRAMNRASAARQPTPTERLERCARLPRMWRYGPFWKAANERARAVAPDIDPGGWWTPQQLASRLPAVSALIQEDDRGWQCWSIGPDDLCALLHIPSMNDLAEVVYSGLFVRPEICGLRGALWTPWDVREWIKDLQEESA